MDSLTQQMDVAVFAVVGMQQTVGRKFNFEPIKKYYLTIQVHSFEKTTPPSLNFREFHKLSLKVNEDTPLIWHTLREVNSTYMYMYICTCCILTRDWLQVKMDPCHTPG